MKNKNKTKPRNAPATVQDGTGREHRAIDARRPMLRSDAAGNGGNGGSNGPGLAKGRVRHG